jgi:hypothetical protein
MRMAALSEQSDERFTAGSSQRVRFSGVFQQPGLEARYRQEQLPQDLARVRGILAVTVPGCAFFALSDYRLFGETAQFQALLVTRVVVITASVLFLAALRRCERASTFDRLLLAWCLLVALQTAYVTWTRPPTYLGYAALHAVMVFALYTVVPLPLAMQTVPALVISAGSALPHLRTATVPDTLATTAMLAAFGSANLLGFFASRDLQRWKRQQYAALLTERELRAGLERAIAEIKTLRGILPICSHCRRIRDDAGYWKQVEVYVRDHTHAEFSHSICPQCVQTHYPARQKR